MNREIKFRVWDKDYSKMHICGTNTHDAINFLENQACYYNQQNGCGSLPNGEGTYDLMQYTGLKDKNGVEIYEGDIVSGESYATAMARHHRRDVTSKQKLYGIRFERGSFRLYDLVENNWVAIIDHHVMSIANELSVIGNIYQNPELLERGE